MPVKKAVLLVLLVSSMLHSKSQVNPSTINQVKAVFLFNFAQFVTWPANAFPSNSSPFVIGVLGNDPFGNFLEKVVEGETVAGRTIVVRRYAQTNEIKNCHILFINKENPREVTRQLAGMAVLTVGDTENFARSGGMIGFYLDENKIRLQINPKTAKAANITISSKLLRLANVIEE